jgi:hypothetical protein
MSAPAAPKGEQMEDTEISPSNNLVVLAAPFVVDGVALAKREMMSATFAQCDDGLQRLKRIYGAARYWLGDLMNLTEGLFAEEASQLIDESFLSEAEVKAFTFVAAKVQPTARAHAPSWEHAKVVAVLPHEEQLEWLDKARAEAWSARKLASEVAQAKAGGKTVMRFWLVVECGTEARRDKLADRLEGEGYGVKRSEKLAKAPKVKRAKKGPVTAQRKQRGAPKRNRTKRVPA